MKRRTFLSAAGAVGIPGAKAQTATKKSKPRRALRDAQEKAKTFVGDDNFPPFPSDPGNHPASLPYLFFQISNDDVGNPNVARTALTGFADRKPNAVEWQLAANTVLLHVSNGGAAASDLIRIDYQLVYCTLQEHKPEEGFTTVHAGESEGSTSPLDLLTLDFVLPGKKKSVPIKLDSFSSVRNIYVRARVTSLFSPIV